MNFTRNENGSERELRKQSKTEADMRTAPDPFAAVLPAISALGAIASIAAINWVGQEGTPDRSRSRRKAGMELKDLESCCMQLHDIFRKFQKHPKLFTGEGAPAAPMKFGVHGSRVESDAARLYQQIVSDVASVLVLAAHNSFEAMSSIEDGEINAPEDIFFGFGEQQERLNKLIQSRATLKVTVDTGVEIAEKLTGLVRELKKYKVE
jgi:hypothetical protein